MVHWLIEMGYIPSFCTACYREGRTGDRFMGLCKTGQIQNCCHPNALMTLAEYLTDYADGTTKAPGMDLIRRELLHIPNPRVQELATAHVHEIVTSGRRDFHF